MTDLSMTPIPMRGTTRGRRRQGIMTPVTESEDGWNSRSIIGKACGGAALTVALAWSSWWLADSPGSDFPAWLSAWATVFGVAAAIVAGFYAARAFRLEFQRERRWEEGQRTAQASLVGAWPGALKFGSYERTGGIYEPDTTTIVGVSVYARNASPLPVSEVRITFVLAFLDTNGRVQGSSSIGSEFLASLGSRQRAEADLAGVCEPR